MLDFLTSEYFIGLVLGFVLLYMFQVLWQGPKEAERNQRIGDYMERLGEENIGKIETLLSEKKIDEGLSFIQEQANVGMQEAKETLAFIKKSMKKRA